MTGDGEASRAIADAVCTRYEELGAAAPRFGIFLCDCVDADAVRKAIDRIPEGLDDCLEEVVVMLDRPSREALFSPHDLRGRRRLPLRFHRPPRDLSTGRDTLNGRDTYSGHDAGYGAVRKAAFEYALLKGFDQVIVMRGDGSHPPECLPKLMSRALDDPDRFVLAARSGRDRASSSWRRWSHRLATFVQNRIVGMRLEDYDSSFRLYPSEALRRIPFQLNADDSRFELEVILQLRALGISIHEEPLLDGTAGDGSGNDDFAHDLAACTTAIGYRFHQLHLTRNGRYLVDHEIHYTFKHSETGSHVQIVSAIEAGSEVLDLGCSSGLLARPLLEKNVRVTGVDVGPGERLSKDLTEYYQRDLELPLELPYGRDFGYVVCADVIEHLRNRSQLLRGARRYLKPDGRLIISTPNIALWFYRLSLLVGRFEYGARGVLDETHVHLYTGSTFQREVENAGFDVIRKRVTALPFEVVFESTGRSRLIRNIALAYHSLARLWPSMFAYQYILEARITTLDEEAIVVPERAVDDTGADPRVDGGVG